MEYWYGISTGLPRYTEYLFEYRRGAAPGMHSCNLGSHLNSILGMDWRKAAGHAVELCSRGGSGIVKALVEKIDEDEGGLPDGFKQMLAAASEFSLVSSSETSKHEVEDAFSLIEKAIRLVVENVALHDKPDALRIAASAAGILTPPLTWVGEDELAQYETALRKMRELLRAVPQRLLSADVQRSEAFALHGDLAALTLQLQNNPTDFALEKARECVSSFEASCKATGVKIDDGALDLPLSLDIGGSALSEAQIDSVRYLSADPAMRRFKVDGIAQFVVCSAISCLEAGFWIVPCPVCNRPFVKYSSHTKGCRRKYKDPSTGVVEDRSCSVPSRISSFERPPISISKDKTNYQQRLIKKIKSAQEPGRDPRLRRLLAGIQASLVGHMDEYGRLPGMTAELYREWLQAMTAIDIRSYKSKYLSERGVASPVSKIESTPDGSYKVVLAEFDFAAYREKGMDGLAVPSPMIDVCNAGSLEALGRVLSRRLVADEGATLSEGAREGLTVLTESFVFLLFEASSLLSPANFHMFVTSDRSTLGEVSLLFNISSKQVGDDLLEVNQKLLDDMSYQLKRGGFYDSRRKCYVPDGRRAANPDARFVRKWDEFKLVSHGPREEAVAFCAGVCNRHGGKEGFRRYLDSIAEDLVKEALAETAKDEPASRR